MLFTVK